MLSQRLLSPIVVLVFVFLAACGEEGAPASVPTAVQTDTATAGPLTTLPTLTPTPVEGAALTVRPPATATPTIGASATPEPVATAVHTPVPATVAALETTATPTLTATPPPSDGPAPTIELGCPFARVPRDYPVRCGLQSEGEIESLTWTAIGGSPSTGGDRAFETRFSSLGEASIALEACNRGRCTSATHRFEVVDSEDTWTGPSECTGDDVTFTASPIDPAVIVNITPLGQMGSSHVTPTDHTYFSHDQPTTVPPTYDVKSPAGGLMVELQTMPGHLMPDTQDPAGVLEDWRVTIWHSCTVSTIYIHLGGIAPEILAMAGGYQEGAPYYRGLRAIPVEAGQVIGKVRPGGIDFSVHDTRLTLEGFVVPSRYDGEVWKIHTADPFDYFVEPLRSQLLEKNLRTAEPRGGRIDYDIDGRLVGNWFLDETLDYRASGPLEIPYYWYGHLSIVYDHFDPAQIRISIGAETGIDETVCSVCAGTYGVRDNAPDPAAVGVDTGVVKYELLGRLHFGDPRVMTINDERNVLGVFLVQMVDDQTIRVEVFPGRTAGQVEGFSDAASIYRR
jgi:hypothetical protein